MFRLIVGHSHNPFPHPSATPTPSLKLSHNHRSSHVVSLLLLLWGRILSIQPVGTPEASSFTKVIHQCHLQLHGQYLELVVLILMKTIKILTTMMARMRTLTMTAVMMRTTASPSMLPVMTRSLMTTTANVICIVIPNSSIVCYWKMKNPLNPIM
jgi:hypothetical protein